MSRKTIVLFIWLIIGAAAAGQRVTTLWAAVELVAQWRAESADRRRKALRRREHDRRRRYRAELSGG